MTAPEDCLFCRIATHQLPTRIVFETDRVMAFHDQSPVTPVHVVVIPKIHVERLSELEDQDRELAADLMLGAKRAAREAGIDEAGYCVVTKSGENIPPSVPHLHLHVLGGRELQWPPA